MYQVCLVFPLPFTGGALPSLNENCEEMVRNAILPTRMVNILQFFDVRVRRMPVLCQISHYSTRETMTYQFLSNGDLHLPVASKIGTLALLVAFDPFESAEVPSSS